jgi:hypothetical protein
LQAQESPSLPDGSARPRRASFAQALRVTVRLQPAPRRPQEESDPMKHILFAGVAALVLAAPASANEFAAQLTELAKGEIAKMVAAPEVVEAVKAQNAETAAHDQAKLDALDGQWRAEVGAADQPLIKATLEKPASKYLAMQKEQAGGLFTEIFVMDAKGLNVAQSDVTSDYWQGDEEKWAEVYPKGAGALHLSEVEQDESTQTYQSQVSMPVVDPADGSVIGAVTVGVNVEMLQ